MILEQRAARGDDRPLGRCEIVYANVMLGTLFGTSAQSLIGRKAVDLYFDATEREPMIRALEAERVSTTTSFVFCA